MSGDAASAFRFHLATCARCQAALRGRMLEAAIVDEAADHRTPPIHDPRSIDQLAARRRLHWRVAVSTGIAAAAVLLWCIRPRPTELGIATIALRPERGVEVRLSAPELDGYRPYGVVRAADGAAREQIKQGTLAALDAAGRLNAFVGARALNGDVRSAIDEAGRLPRTAQSLADRAALELIAVDTAETVSAARQQAAAERAITLAAKALELEPASIHALWNRAIAFKRLQLPLVAAQAFDEIAARGEPGWSSEARDNAARLRADYQADADERKRIQGEADAMIAGGPPLDAQTAQRSPSVVRRAFHLAVATAATAERLDALLPLARALDVAFATAAMTELVQRVRGSNLARRAPLARALGQAKPDEIRAIRERAIQLGLADIALASFLRLRDGESSEADVAALDRIAGGHADPWWRVFAIMRRTYFLQYRERDPAQAEAVARAAVPLCRAQPMLWCERIAIFAGAANADMGRLDIALEQLSTARQLARQPMTRDDEGFALDVMGQMMTYRVQEAIDPVALSDAYLSEYALRKASCEARLHRLDFVAWAALDRHFYQRAGALRAQADALEAGDCRAEPPRLNGETVRLRLAVVRHGDVAAPRLAALEAADDDYVVAYIRFLRAANAVTTDRAGGEAALRSVIADADADPSKPLASLARSTAYSTLIEVAAAAGEPDSVVALLAARNRLVAPERCLVAIAQWNRAAIALRGAGGERAIEIREVPAGSNLLPAGELISPALRAKLAGCRRVEVMTDGRYFGTAGILPPAIPWVYRTAGAPVVAPRAGSELIVSDVAPPDDYNLPQLRSFKGSPSAVALRRGDATPSAVLAAMATASLVVIVAHGFTDTREPDAASLILSPDRDGEHQLTALAVSGARLANAPVVVLAGCNAARAQVSTEPWSLASSFRAAGARAVIAPTEQIPDAAASEAFESLVARVRAGADPVDALQAERSSRGPSAAWLSSIVVFE